MSIQQVGFGADIFFAAKSGQSKAAQPKKATAPTGTKVRLWKQDPSVGPIGIRTSYIHTAVHPGPKDADIVIKGLPAVTPDKDGNYLFDNTKQPEAFDSVHTFAVVRQVLTMFRRAALRMGTTTPVNWQWGAQAPIEVYPHAGDDANAYYSRQEKAMKFFSFTSPQKPKMGEIFTTRSFDIVSHETGHAVLDGLKPGFLSSWHPQSGGLHESFGDLSAIFTMLSQLDQCEAIIAESKANLHDKTFFSAMAEQFGEALGRPHGLRNADNNLKMSDVSTEVHDISQVFTGAVYNILADMFEDAKALDKEDPAMTLFKTGDHLLSVVLGALAKSPAKNATYKDVALNMIALESNASWKKMIEKRFTEREILNTPVQQKSQRPQQLTWDKCCSTLKRQEYKDMFKLALIQAQTDWDAKQQNP